MAIPVGMLLGGSLLERFGLRAVVKLLEEGAIPHQKVGTHRRVRFDDVMTYKRRRDREQEVALVRPARLSQELGLYDISYEDLEVDG